MRNKFLGTGQQGFNPIRKLRIAYSGLRYAILNESSVAIEIILSALVLTACFYYRQWLDFNIVLVATGLMLIAEMVNTAIEALCDFVEAGHNEKIGIIKDVASAAVGISILVWSVTLLMEIVRLWQGVR
ncbi:MAG: diacylglycerol kinase [Chloroflexi bacterium HGW-Chloroflexi-6]|nr:MAG: diacylglycerol kinase [Chloroflexi bacterium HGW-Chloroflexi-6]